MTKALWLAGFVMTVVPPTGGWESAGTHGGVAIEVRSAAGSDVRELRAEGTLRAPIAEVRRAIVDFQAYPGHMPYVTETHLVRRVDDGVIVYQRVSPPILSDRDEVLHVRIDHDLDGAGGQFVTRWEAANGDGPAPVPGVVRLSVCSGSWTLTPIDAERTHVSFQLHLDPGGMLPAWAVNLANTQAVPGLFRAVEELAIARPPGAVAARTRP